MNYDLFMSYASEDHAIAVRLCEAMERAGIRCWYAPRDITPGENRVDAIAAAISSCRMLVLIFSSHSNASTHIRREIHLAAEKSIPVLPIRIEDVLPEQSLFYYIGNIHFLDALEPPLEKHIESLVEQVASLLTGTVQPAQQAEALRPPKARIETASPALPSGVVTLLMSDVENSTQLWQKDEARMRQALAQMDAVAKECTVQNNGYLIKSRGEGDSHFLIFASPTDALHAAIAWQMAMRQLRMEDGSSCPLAVRMALHVGEMVLREGDYYGVEVNRCARLREIAHGGQILLSEVAARMTQNSLPEDLFLKEMGVFSLRDLPAERVFQACHPQLQTEFPPLKAHPLRKHNLPPPLNEFLGREKEISLLKSLLTAPGPHEGRLITLLGPSGCGKTRLAQQTAREVADLLPDGAWFVSLSAIRDVSMLPQAVASSLSLRLPAQGDPEAILLEKLHSKKLLLILDNIEHLQPDIALSVKRILLRCLQIWLIVTSLQRLHITGERIFQVPPLPLPKSRSYFSLQELQENPAIALFIARARAHAPDWNLTAQNARAVERICRRLDGIPLAIELAAARIRVLSAEQIAAHIQSRFRLLTGGVADENPRHSTLRRAFDWSYELLSDPEKALFRRLSVFAGRFTLQEVEKVCSDDTLQLWDLLGLLTQLLDRALVIQEQGSVARYHLLETLREYGQERAQEEGELSCWQDRHLQYYSELAQTLAEKYQGEDQSDALEETEKQYDNLRAALHYSLQAPGKIGVGLGLALNLYPFWCIRGYLSEGRAFLREVLSSAQFLDEDADRARALVAAGALAWIQGDYPQARSLFHQALHIRQVIADEQGTADILNNLANVALDLGEWEEARQLLTQARERFSSSNDLEGLSAVISNLALVACETGAFEEAWSLYGESGQLDERLQNRWGVAFSLDGRGEIALRRKDYPTAEELKIEAMKLRREMVDMPGLAESMEGLAATYAGLGDVLLSITLLGCADALREEIDAPLPPRSRETMMSLRQSLRAQCKPEEFDQALRQGREMNWQEVVSMIVKSGPRSHRESQYTDYKLPNSP